MGVCGVGMGGVARLLAQRGWLVDGCDNNPSPPMRDWLEQHGIKVCRGHDPRHLSAGADLLVRSAAVPEDHAECLAASRAGITLLSRGRLLASLLDGRRGIIVCGAHGKTSSSVGLVRLLRLLGFAPGWCVGGWGPDLEGVAGEGGGDILLAEADESDGTLAEYRPWATLLTNVDYDHAEHFDGPRDHEECFCRVVMATRRLLVYCADDVPTRRVAAAARCPETLAYGLDAGHADLLARDIAMSARGCRFEVWLKGRKLGLVRIAAAGLHNVRNALGILGVALSLDRACHSRLNLLTEAYRLPQRRFQCHASNGGVKVYSDYAHHPRELAAMMSMARLHSKTVRVVFQPHRYSRTKSLGDDFPPAFEGAREVTMVPVYAASEAPLEGGTGADLYAKFRSFAGNRDTELRYAESPDSALEGVLRRLRRGDMLLVAGAGDVLRIAEKAAGHVRNRHIGRRTPIAGQGEMTWGEFKIMAREKGFQGRLYEGKKIARYTGYGCGGGSDGVAEPGNREDLEILLALAADGRIPLRVLGHGRNVNIGDDGAPGLLVRLNQPWWRRWRIEGDRVWVAAGTPGHLLLQRLAAAGLGGLSFMAGIPGTVGGWLAMNAGAHGGVFGNCVESVDCLTRDGGDDNISGRKCGWGYRDCRALRDRVAVGAWLRPVRRERLEIEAEIASFRKRRLPLDGLGCCGSLFRNPPGDSAGRLLDLCGFRGSRIGGAFVDRRHANILLADGQATSSDLRALAERMRLAVERRFGIRLEFEVCFW